MTFNMRHESRLMNMVTSNVCHRHTHTHVCAHCVIIQLNTARLKNTYTHVIKYIPIMAGWVDMGLQRGLSRPQHSFFQTVIIQVCITQSMTVARSIAPLQLCGCHTPPRWLLLDSSRQGHWVVGLEMWFIACLAYNNTLAWCSPLPCRRSLHECWRLVYPVHADYSMSNRCAASTSPRVQSDSARWGCLNQPYPHTHRLPTFLCAKTWMSFETEHDLCRATSS